MKRAIYRCWQCREFPEGLTSAFCGTAGKVVGARSVVCLYGRIRKGSDMTTTDTPQAFDKMCACGRDDFKNQHALSVHIGRSSNPKCAAIDRPKASTPPLVPTEPAAPAHGAHVAFCDHLPECRETGHTWCGDDPCDLLGRVKGQAEEVPLPEKCEVCGDPATRTSSEGTPLCDQCMAETIADNAEDALVQMGVPEDVRDAIMQPLLADLKRRFGTTEVRSCRVCGCTEETPCVDDDDMPCSWVEDDLCSACADKATRPKATGSAFIDVPGIFNEGRNSAELRAANGILRAELVRAWATVAELALPEPGYIVTDERMQVAREAIARVKELSR